MIFSVKKDISNDREGWRRNLKEAPKVTKGSYIVKLPKPNCDNSNICSTCQNCKNKSFCENRMNTSKMLKCLQCKNCTECDNENICIKCDNDYYMINDDTNNCIAASNIQIDEYYLNNGTMLYSCNNSNYNNILNCKKCSDKTSCSLCKDEFTFIDDYRIFIRAFYIIKFSHTIHLVIILS